ncbi:DUF1513 domain-containing protein [Parendozoicomonas sp. Alg238-R29]|uniref:DUF1513 domain-containing protein n=1 Tax=Parendozoicomonas sp. Alg238-R29 TaxID=2993446 RepID=UPI00248E1D66|nr:DUF1513 domain-containing protein [Parendozoicomonas sp. Alg238-R29]
MLSRREFLSQLLMSGAAIAAGSLAGCSFSQNVSPLLSVARDRKGQYSIRIFSPETVQQRILNIPGRAHGLSLHPSGRIAVCHDRRPGRRMYIVDLEDQSLSRTLEAAPNRHFFGHGVFSPDGNFLYTTENNYQKGEGVIGGYQVSDWSRIDEFSSRGIGCHELRLHPDGETLVVANGGILTHPDQPRKKLNLESMTPKLSYINRHTGELLEERSFGHHQLSIRHLDVADDGTAVIGMQYQGDKTDIQPLVALHRRGEAIQPMVAEDDQWLGLSQYIASVVCLPGSQIAVTTTPRGNRVVFWNMNARRQIASFHVSDVAGAALTGSNQVTVSNGGGELITYSYEGYDMKEASRLRYPDTNWDNHMASSTTNG